MRCSGASIPHTITVATTILSSIHLFIGHACLSQGVIKFYWFLMIGLVFHDQDESIINFEVWLYNKINFNKALRIYCKIAYRRFLLISPIIFIEMTANKELNFNYADLEDVRMRLFPDSAPRSHDQNSTIKKQRAGFANESTPVRKIKLKHHMKTECTPKTPSAMREANLKTTPNHNSPLSRIQQFRASTFNATTSPKKNSHAAHNYTSNQPQNGKHPPLTVFPSPSRQSLIVSRLKESIIKRSSKSKSKQNHLLSKSRKKNLFTVFTSREKSIKQSSSPHKAHQIQYAMPYRYHSSITIELFDSSIKNTNRSKSKSINKSEHANKPINSSKRLNASHLLAQPQDERIKRALQKLKSYKFVFEYIAKSEIVERLKSYAFKNEPECKWPLLIVDEVFKRERIQASIN